jgi:hypothetical protein
MDAEHNLAVANFIQSHIEECGYSVAEVATLSGFKRVENLEAILRGDWKLSMDKVSSLAGALGCNKQQLFMLAFTSWFRADFERECEEAFAAKRSKSTERTWISFLRELYSGDVPNLTPSLRRRIKLLTSMPG